MKLEKYAAGKYFVYSSGPYPVRIGHVCGGKSTWLAEKGPETLGYFKTKKAAAEAIIEQAETRVSERCGI